MAAALAHAFLFLHFSFLILPSHAQTTAATRQSPRLETQQDTLLRNVRLEQRLNHQIPADIPFRDESGKSVRIGDYFGEKPVMLMLIQYRCTMLCTEEMNVLLESLKKLRFTPGKEFTFVTVTIDPREGPGLAMEQKEHYLREYGRPEAASGWHFLTGDEASIKRLADATGFHYVYDPHTDQYAHPDGVILTTPAGKIARYFFRLEYPAQDLRFGLIQAADNKIGTPLDAIALLCFHYNPSTGKYSLVVMNVVRLFGIIMLIAFAAWLVIMRRFDRARAARVGDAALGAGS